WGCFSGGEFVGVNVAAYSESFAVSWVLWDDNYQAGAVDATGSTDVTVPEYYTYNIYAGDGTLIGNTADQQYTVANLVAETEYCFYATTVSDVGAESDSSNHACATPLPPVAELPMPQNLTGYANGYQVYINWDNPDIPGGGDPVFSEDFEDGLGDMVDESGTWMAGTATETGLPDNGGTFAYIDDDFLGSTAPAVDAVLWTSDVSVDGPVNMDLMLSVYYPQLGGDCASGGSWSDDAFIWVAIDGGTPTMIAPVPVTGGWEDLSFQLGTVTASVKAGIQYTDCGGNWAYYIAVDNVRLQPTPEYVLTHYNVFRDNEAVGETSDTSFYEVIVEEGTYSYTVTANYWLYGESEPAGPVSVEVTTPTASTNPPQNLMAESSGNDVMLSWDRPEGTGGWMEYPYGDLAYYWGYGADGYEGGTMEFAIRLDEQLLAPFLSGGFSLSRMAFMTYSIASTYTANIYTVDTDEAGVESWTLASTTPVEVSSENTYPNWTVADFDTPVEVVLDVNRDYVMSVTVVFPPEPEDPASGTYTLFSDAGPAVMAGFSDLRAVSTDETTGIPIFESMGYNFALAAYVDMSSPDGTSSEPILVNDDIEYMMKRSGLFTNSDEPEMADASYPLIQRMSTNSSRALHSYRIVRNDASLDTISSADGEAYMDYDAPWGDHTYYVTALYDEGESVPSNMVTVSLVNNPPGSFILIEPANNYNVTVTPTTMMIPIPFIWMPATDPDNDLVNYYMAAHDDGGVYFDSSSAMTNMFITTGDFAADQIADGVGVMTYLWDVWAHDSWDSTSSDNGPHTLTVDVSAVLEIDDIGLPEVFALHNNYPNPFNPVTNISYDIPEAAEVSLEIFNVAGQKIRTIAQGLHEPGRYRVQWNATNDIGQPLSSGMYIYRIQAGDFISVKKLILMK
ncbi:MAG: hypothetical protein CMG57_07695, partial [Candidatus Marinimicrobia bacterium]|nr:hypothetical protein [Candidatus Neomarinimicrobiota bacterium]